MCRQAPKKPAQKQSIKECAEKRGRKHEVEIQMETDRGLSLSIYR